MSYEIPILVAPFLANADLSASQYAPVSLTTAGRVQVMTGLTDGFIGVLQDKTTAAGLSCRVMVSGISKVLVDLDEM